ncbi:hypothetical protein KY289_036378 [Solanum tuberosum]|nr:hypothetical protein KY289_036378 [Solanum tuberosum]
MPRIPLNSQRRRANSRRSPRRSIPVNSPALPHSIQHEPSTTSYIPNHTNNNGGSYLLCNPSTRTKPTPPLLVGTEPPRPSFIIQCGSGREECGRTSAEPDFPSPSSIGGYEACNRDLQQPFMVVDGPTTPSEPSFPPNSFLPSLDLGNTSP